MSTQQEEVTQKNTLQELAEIRANAKAVARGDKKEDELPAGADPLEASSEEVPAEEVVKPAVSDKVWKIGDKEFKSEDEVFKYAEKMENDRLIENARNEGIREALLASQRPEAPVVEEDNFDEKFYSNPKQALMEAEERATKRALAVVDARDAEKAAWSRFSEAYPDLSGREADVRRILQENWEVLGKLKDEKVAMQILATKTRSYFQDIVDSFKPKTELKSTSVQAVSTGGQQKQNVTNVKKEDRPLTLSEQMRRLKERA